MCYARKIQGEDEMAFRQVALGVGSMALVFAGFVPLRPAARCAGDHHLSKETAAAHGSHAAHDNHAAHTGGLGPAAAHGVSHNSTTFAHQPCACSDRLPPATRPGARLALFDFERAKAALGSRALLPAHSPAHAQYAGARLRSPGSPSPSPFSYGPPGSRSCALYLIVCSILC